MADKIDISGRASAPALAHEGEPHQSVHLVTTPRNVGKERNPDRNLPRATVLGTIATAVVYMLSPAVVFAIVPTSQLAAARRRRAEASSGRPPGPGAETSL